jgi:putative transcriptional regulator
MLDKLLFKFYNTNNKKEIEVTEVMINHIKEHRARLDLTQEKLAERVGVTRQTIISIEAGRYVPSSLLALKIARVFERPVEQIFQLKEANHE